jgi:hypothetical protein
MFDTKEIGWFVALSSVIIGSFTTTAKADFLPRSTTSNIVQVGKLKPKALTFLASGREESRSQQASVKLEELRNLPRYIDIGQGEGRFPDRRFDVYNKTLRGLQLLPSKGQSQEIRTGDNKVQRLLKQQLNDALESYQIVGRLLDTGKLKEDDDASDLIAMSAVQIAIDEAELASNLNERRVANETCVRIATAWEKDADLRERAGVGTRSDVFKARYWRLHCEAQKMSSQKNISALGSTANSQRQQQTPTNLRKMSLSAISTQGQYKLRDNGVEDYNANVERLQKLSSKGQTAEIHTQDSDIQSLQKQQLNTALEIYKLQGLRLAAGLAKNGVAEIILPAVQVSISDMSLATTPTKRTLANDVCLEITQAWEKKAAQEKTASDRRIPIFTTPYWKRYCEIQKVKLRA